MPASTPPPHGPPPSPAGAVARGRRPRLPWLLALVWAIPAPAQLPLPKLDTLFPPALEPGATVEITATGTDLDPPATLRFSHPGIQVTPKAGTPATFEVQVPPDLPPGWVEARFVGRFGASNPRPLLVAPPAPRGLSVPANNITPASAFPLPLDTPCRGRVSPSQAHWFRFEARASQRLRVQVEAATLDSRLVPDVAVLDESNRELAVARRSEVLDFTPAADGKYHLRLHDQTYRGGDAYAYQLTISTGPRIEFAVPPVVQPGSEAVLTLYGRSLPGGRPGSVRAADGQPLEEVQVRVSVPVQAQARTAPVAALPRRPSALAFSPQEDWIHLPIPFSVSPAPIVPLTVALASSPRPVLPTPDPAAAPTAFPRIPAPAELGALFPARGDKGGWTFEARKDQVFWLEIASERLGFYSDARLVVQRLEPGGSPTEKPRTTDVLELNDLEANPGGREFDVTSRDCAGRLKIPTDGTYRILVRNLFDAGPTGGRVPYWLSLRLESPDFRLAVQPQAQPRLNDADRQVHLWTPVLRRGETQPVRVIAFRRDGFEGPIEVLATQLPPGVSATPARIPAGQHTTSLLLTAATNAPSGQAALRVEGRARIGDQDLAHPASPAASIWHVQDWDQERAVVRPLEDLLVSVCNPEATPVIVTATPSSEASGAFQATATAGSKVAIPLQIRREEGFPAAFSLRLQGHPEAEKRKEVAIPEKATGASLELDLAETKLPPGTHTLWLQGLVTGQYRNNPAALADAEAALKAATEGLAQATPETKPAAEERRKIAEAARKSAEEKAKPRSVTLAVYSSPFTLTVLAPANGKTSP